MDPKVELEGIVRRLTGQQPHQQQSGDVEVETVQLSEGGFCSSVMLTPLGMISFTGEVCEKAEAAASSAVLTALAEFAAVGRLASQHLGGQGNKPNAQQAFFAPGGELDAPAVGAMMQMMNPMPVGAFKMPTGPASPVGRGAPLVKPSPLFQKKPIGGAVEANAKGDLNMLLAKILGRPLTKEDQVYSTEPNGTGFSSTLTLPAVGAEGYTGAPCKTKKDAEQSAAASAVAKLQALAPAPKKPKLPSAAMKKLGNLTGAGSPAASPRPPAPEDPEIQAWQKARLEDCGAGDVQDKFGLDLWYGQVCLVCLCVVPKSSWATHSAGARHKKQFECRPVKKRPELSRPPTEPSRPCLPAEFFIGSTGWKETDAQGKHVPVLIVGEMDYSFSLAVAKLRTPGAPLVATSYLEAHDPNELEVYPSDDGERAAYSRRSLPAMKGDLFRNLEGLRVLGCEVRHGVDAMNLNKTLRSQGIGGAFKRVVFPFPRASLQRACDPRNSKLLRNFFFSVQKEGFLVRGGIIQLVMLATQYEEWDVAGMAADAGLELVSRVSLPGTFYQSREMSGKPWTPQGAELLNFAPA